ncbi:hypothetical protein CYMTET_37481 [Cymbomonas tetramitiformis]|uniref:EGF-like domain-containing protein n=1 Tax=Cymbomonas tetramitiformis TaxID=36881 RepID=A0AAE0CDU0_9CHLO|nr:hypothetical protein CYMTET_37481 [Cymbomonas tetramitiformis]
MFTLALLLFLVNVRGEPQKTSTYSLHADIHNMQQPVQPRNSDWDEAKSSGVLSVGQHEVVQKEHGTAQNATNVGSVSSAMKVSQQPKVIINQTHTEGGPVGAPTQSAEHTGHAQPSVVGAITTLKALSASKIETHTNGGGAGRALPQSAANKSHDPGTGSNVLNTAKASDAHTNETLSAVRKTGVSAPPTVKTILASEKGSREKGARADITGRPSNCSVNCSHVGTCYEPLGRCDCPYGYSGDACQEHTLPAYQAVYDNETAHDALCAKYHPRCGAEVGHGFCREGQCVCAPGRTGKHCSQFDRTYCMGSCSCHGVCRLGFCHCDQGFFGVDCSLTSGPGDIPIRWRCRKVLPSKMQDEDEEAQNVLVDKKPRHVFPLPGTASAPRMTDSLSRNATGFPSNPRRPALLIYVYELPPSLNVWLAADHAAGWPMEPASRHSVHPSLANGGGIIGPAELFLWERLLASNHRTLDPEQADFFFVPTLSRPAAGGWIGFTSHKGRLQQLERGNRHQQHLGDLAAANRRREDLGNKQYSGRWERPGKYWQEVVDYISATWPYWNRHNGNDHLFVLPGDHGACDSPRGLGIPEVLRNSRLITHWGLITNSSRCSAVCLIAVAACGRDEYGGVYLTAVMA